MISAWRWSVRDAFCIILFYFSTLLRAPEAQVRQVHVLEQDDVCSEDSAYTMVVFLGSRKFKHIGPRLAQVLYGSLFSKVKPWFRKDIFRKAPFI